MLGAIGQLGAENVRVLHGAQGVHAQQPVDGRQPARYATGSNDGSVGAERRQFWQISHRLQSVGLRELGQHRHPVDVLEGRRLQERASRRSSNSAACSCCQDSGSGGPCDATLVARRGDVGQRLTQLITAQVDIRAAATRRLTGEAFFGLYDVPCSKEQGMKTLIIIRYILVRECQYATDITVAGSTTRNIRWPDRRTAAGKPDRDDLCLVFRTRVSVSESLILLGHDASAAATDRRPALAADPAAAPPDHDCDGPRVRPRRIFTLSIVDHAYDHAAVLQLGLRPSSVPNPAPDRHDPGERNVGRGQVRAVRAPSHPDVGAIAERGQPRVELGGDAGEIEAEPQVGGSSPAAASYATYPYAHAPASVAPASAASTGKTCSGR